MTTFIPRVLGLSAIVMAIGGYTTASAFAANLVDASVTSPQGTCTWTNGATSADPPSTLTIDRNTVNAPGGNLTCGGASVTLNNDPTVTFDDAARTATADLIDVTAAVSGITCRYAATNTVLMGDTLTRTYSGSLTAQKAQIAAIGAYNRRVRGIGTLQGDIRQELARLQSLTG